MRGLMSESLQRSSRLSDDGQAEPFLIHNESGSSPLVVVCDHAGRAVPDGLELGVPAADMDRHIAWDIGAGGLSVALGGLLDACVARQPYSRLVIDCNRGPDWPDAMPEVSDGTTIPANVDLGPEARAWRRAAIHEPYHARIAALLEARASAGRDTALVFMHSFTPVMAAFERPWTFGILHTGQPLALAVLRRLREAGAGDIGDNQPYAMDGTDYSAGRHGTARGLDFVEIEVRQDLIAEAAGQAAVAELFGRLLPEALDETRHR
jgi:predicted N-formylglutamate amidohydrolase